eukprot:COSAG01_NODE_9613_length_2389_cov_4.000000_1_plen_119_part_00
MVVRVRVRVQTHYVEVHSVRPPAASGRALLARATSTAGREFAARRRRAFAAAAAAAAAEEKSRALQGETQGPGPAALLRWVPGDGSDGVVSLSLPTAHATRACWRPEYTSDNSGGGWR